MGGTCVKWVLLPCADGRTSTAVNRAAKNHLIFASGSGTTELTSLQQQQTPVYCYGYFPSHIYKQDSYKYIYIVLGCWPVLYCLPFVWLLGSREGVGGLVR